MAKKDSHSDVRFIVLGPGGQPRTFHSLDQAAAFVFREAMQGGRWTNLTVRFDSEAGARWWGGEEAVEHYRSNPDVVEQLTVKVNTGSYL